MVSKHSDTGGFVARCVHSRLLIGCVFLRCPIELALISNTVSTVGTPRARFRFLVAFMLMIACCQGSPEQTDSPPSAQRAGWILTWNDEFNGANGSSPDPTKWVVQSGGNGWGNDELEYYTARPQNVRQENGNLVIEAVKERFSGPDGVRRDYTSARLKTEGLFRQRYGRFEARIQISSRARGVACILAAGR